MVDTHEYESLYRAIISRDAETIISFTRHSNPEIQNQAWRALYNTKIDVDLLFTTVFNSDNDFAWFALGRRTLERIYIDKMEQRWLETKPEHRHYLSDALGLNGDAASLKFLFSQIPTFTHKADEDNASLAISRLMVRYPMIAGQITTWISEAVQIENLSSLKYRLYGLYRSSRMPVDENQAVQLFKFWRQHNDVIDNQSKEMLLHICAKAQLDELPDFLLSQDINNQTNAFNVQLSQSVHLYSDHKMYSDLIAHSLNSTNETVISQALSDLIVNDVNRDALQSLLENNSLIRNQSQYVNLHLDYAKLRAGMEVNKGADYYEEHLVNHPHWSDIILRILEIKLSKIELINETIRMLPQKSALVQMSLLQKLNQLWKSADIKTKKVVAASLKDAILNVSVFAVNKDRGVYYMIGSFLEEMELFSKSDLLLVAKSLEVLDPVADIEVYQSVITPLYTRLGSDIHPFLEKLSESGYPPIITLLESLNSSLTFPVMKHEATGLTMPNFKKIEPYFSKPAYLRLMTTKGEIVTELDVKRNPATVSMIDSLTKADKYNGVVFHRVVPNFVIQSGDFERGDGFGGGDGMIPTEASELTYEGGSIGMASAGPDTESSQFFFMHTWRPHLDGRYTRFGRVTKGLDVVDAIIQGDIILTAQIIQ